MIEYTKSNEFFCLSWFIEIDEQKSAFNSIIPLLSNKKAIQVHLSDIVNKKRNQLKKGNNSSLINFDPELIKKLLSATIASGLSKAAIVYFIQSYVILNSIFESITKDFAIHVFIKYPSRMYNFI